MNTLIATLLGFIGPFIPELIKLIRQKMDNSQELAILKLQASITGQEFDRTSILLNSDAYKAEQQIIHSPQESFGVQLLDAARTWPKFMITPVFYLFALLDFISGFVRPGVTYAVVGCYLMYKLALFSFLTTETWQQAIPIIWSENDFSILLLTLGYWFGSRVVKATFGGSASSAKAGY